MQKTNHAFIILDSDKRGSHPIISCTGIRVLDIVIEYQYKGYTIDQIIDYHPQLKLEHIHDSLSYYYENQDKMDQQIKEEKKYVEELRNNIFKRCPDLAKFMNRNFNVSLGI